MQPEPNQTSTGNTTRTQTGNQNPSVTSISSILIWRSIFRYIFKNFNDLEMFVLLGKPLLGKPGRKGNHVTDQLSVLIFPLYYLAASFSRCLCMPCTVVRCDGWHISVTCWCRRHRVVECLQVLLKHGLSSRVLFSVLHHRVYPFSHLLYHQLSETKSESPAHHFCVSLYKAQQY